MNERIQKLAEQAGYKHPDAVGECEDYAYFSHEKFAELLIEECAKISESVTPRHTECGNRIAGKIRQFHGDKNEMV
jgi:hypothetical protein